MNVETISTSGRSLKDIAFLDGLAEDELARLAGLCRWHTYAAEQIIVDKGSLSREVYFVIKGGVTIATYSPAGKEIALAVARTRDFFGELAAIDEQPRSASVIAIERSEVAIMPQKVFLDLIRSNGTICFRLLNRLAMLVRESGMRILELSTLPAAQRVYSTLLRLAKPDAAVAGLWVVRPLPPMHDIASLTSTTRETVSRALSQIYPTGIIKKKGHNLYIMDKEKMEEIVQSLQVYNGSK